MRRPNPDEYTEYYGKYINRITTDNILRVMEEQILHMQTLPGKIPEEKENHRYAEGKWTVKGLLGHLADTERIFAYRILRFGRGDTYTHLSGFDKFDYIDKGKFDHRKLIDLVHEFSLTRESNIWLFKSLTSEELDRKGIANNFPISARALIYAMAGHFDHHMEVLRVKYLN
jgi:uncharacterized damage-inducible protein DinB